MNVLTTGILSGLGKYIHENLGGLGLSRQSAAAFFKKAKKTDIIIHCAFNSRRDVDSRNLYPYLQDNLFLTERLARIPHKKFIFISSIDVYPQNSRLHREDEIISADSLKSIYAVTKFVSESIVRRYCKDYLILRPATLLGRHSRKNTLIRMVEESRPCIGLSEKSKFNYVLHSDLLDFIIVALENNLRGIYNISSAENISLAEVAGILGKKKVKFGNILYEAGRISNAKISAFCPNFKKSSAEVLNSFLKERKR